MFIHNAMEALARQGSSISFPLPDNRLHCVLNIEPNGRHVLLRAQVIGEGKALEGDVHRADDMKEMLEFLMDERNETQVRFAIRRLWDKMEGH